MTDAKTCMPLTSKAKGRRRRSAKCSSTRAKAVSARSCKHVI